MSKLLKSWAIPPASRPTASSFCACRSCSSRSRSADSARFRSVTSSTIPMKAAAPSIAVRVPEPPARSARRSCGSRAPCAVPGWLARQPPMDQLPHQRPVLLVKEIREVEALEHLLGRVSEDAREERIHIPEPVLAENIDSCQRLLDQVPETRLALLQCQLPTSDPRRFRRLKGRLRCVRLHHVPE